MNLLDMKKNDITVLQVLMNGDEIRFVEFHSKIDSRDHILNVSRFMEVFGYTEDELKEIK